MSIKVSLIASAVRVPFYKTFLDPLKSTTVPYEVVFAGHNTPEEIEPFNKGYQGFRYIYTARIKPSQCYEIARRMAVGETILWCADDCEFTLDVIGKAYRFWADLKNEKAILSIQTVENKQYVNMQVHSFFGGRPNSGLMAPLGLMSRQFMEDLGGFDRRYIAGQYENDAVMRAIVAGGKIHIFGDRENHIIIDHYARHGIVRPFAEGYNHDRAILEKSWTNGAGKVLKERQDPFEPYVDDGTLLQKSQSFKMNRWGFARTDL